MIVGPVEATALGNAGMQLLAHGHLTSLAEIRDVIRHSTAPPTSEPGGREGQWDEANQRFRVVARGR